MVARRVKAPRPAFNYNKIDFVVVQPWFNLRWMQPIQTANCSFTGWRQPLNQACIPNNSFYYPIRACCLTFATSSRTSLANAGSIPQQPGACHMLTAQAFEHWVLHQENRWFGTGGVVLLRATLISKNDFRFAQLIQNCKIGAGICFAETAKPLITLFRKESAALGHNGQFPTIPSLTPPLVPLLKCLDRRKDG